MNVSNNNTVYWLEKSERFPILSTFTSLYGIGVKLLFHHEKKALQSLI
jgi:hypothetical protein